MGDGLASDPQRDAGDSIRGYVYQAYRSIWAWMRLGPTELLFLEGAEDFDVVVKEEAIATQVKDRPGRSLTLRSKEALDAINNFWTHKEANRDRSVRFRYLTTSERGQEIGSA